MTREEALDCVGKLVKIRNSGKGRQPHPYRGRLLALRGKKRAVVLPFGHNHTEVVPLRDLYHWRNANDWRDK